MHRTVAPTIVLGCSLLTGPVEAQETARYQLERTEAGIVRLDTQTGELSLCAERSGTLVCTPSVRDDETDSIRSKQLRARIEALEARVEALENTAPGNSNLPSESEFEQTMGLMERFFRRFIGVVKDLEKDFSGAEKTEKPQMGQKL